MWHFQTVRDHFFEQETAKRDAPLLTLTQRLVVAIGRSEADGVSGRELLAALDIHVKPALLESKKRSKLDERLLVFLEHHVEQFRGASDLLGVQVSTDAEGAFILDGIRHMRASITQWASRQKKVD